LFCGAPTPHFFFVFAGAPTRKRAPVNANKNGAAELGRRRRGGIDEGERGTPVTLPETCSSAKEGMLSNRPMLTLLLTWFISNQRSDAS